LSDGLFRVTQFDIITLYSIKSVLLPKDDTNLLEFQHSITSLF
jgi:hypothetical protein